MTQWTCPPPCSVNKKKLIQEFYCIVSMPVCGFMRWLFTHLIQMCLYLLLGLLIHSIVNYSSRQVKRYLWFPRKWNHNSINYWISRIYRVWQNQHFLEKRKGSPTASNVENSLINDGICRIGQQLGNWQNLVAVKDRNMCLCYVWMYLMK